MLLQMNDLPNLVGRGTRFQHARKKVAKLTQAAAAEILGVTPQAISQWERDEDTPTLSNLEKVSTAYGVPIDWLTMKPGIRSTAPSPNSQKVPLVSRIKAGLWSPAWNPYENGDNGVLYTEVQISDQAFALEVDGSSMEPDFVSGDVVIIDPRVIPMPGDFVAAKIDQEEEATFKKFRPKGQGVIELVPLNQDWPVLVIDKKTPGKIIGTMVEHRRYRKHRR